MMFPKDNQELRGRCFNIGIQWEVLGFGNSASNTTFKEDISRRKSKIKIYMNINTLSQTRHKTDSIS